MPEVYRWPQSRKDEWLDKKRLFDETTERDWSQLALVGERTNAKRESFFEILVGRLCQERI